MERAFCSQSVAMGGPSFCRAIHSLRGEGVLTRFASLAIAALARSDTTHAVTSDGIGAWDRTWPILLGGFLTALGGFLAQWGRAALDARERRESFKELVAGEMEELIVLQLMAATFVRETKTIPSFEMLRIDKTREGYDQRRSDVELIRT